MTPEQALNLLEAASKTYQGTLADHLKLQEAVKILREAIEPKPKVKKIKEDVKK